MTAIRIDGLTKRYGEDVLAVDDLDLTVESGEVFGFLGPNGAGKSTTINVLLGFLTPTAGSVHVLGEPVSGDTRSIRQRIGLLPEGWEPYENLTGREHVESAIHAKGADDDPDELLDRVGLDLDDAGRPAGQYSTGMQQRMSLAVALVGNPDLLVLDEPSSGLDPDGVSLLREIIREETERGASVFFCSHILEEVEKVSDRVGILQHGRLVALDTIENLRDDMHAGAAVNATLESLPPALQSDGTAPIEAIDGVRSALIDDETVTVEVTEAQAKMRVLRYLDEQAAVVDLTIEEASLEDLFAAYTREEARAATDDGSSDVSPDPVAATPDGGESA